MRDIVIVGMVIGALLLTLARPWCGILAWAWISYMSPHRLAYGFSKDLPLAAMIAATTLVAALIFSGERKPIPASFEVVAAVAFVAWITFTTPFALNPTAAWPYWSQVIKIQAMTFLTMTMIYNRKRIEALMWVIVVSLGFYGIKGGIFSILSGGTFRVQGPDETFIGDNNDLAVALVMILPLMRYLQTQSKSILVRRGLTAAMLVNVLAILGTYSRGGALALAAMTLFLWMKSRRKLVTSVAIIVAAFVTISFMPSKWEERIRSIQDYKDDKSAMGRINAWHFALNLAKDRPILGGGFRVFTPNIFTLYAPDPGDFHAAHSIYFMVLAEQGYPGLILFLVLGVATWRAGSLVIRVSREVDSFAWAGELASMVQVGLIGFAVGGAFGNLAYFDLPYHMMAMLVILKRMAREEAMAANAGEPALETTAVEAY